MTYSGPVFAEMKNPIGSAMQGPANTDAALNLTRVILLRMCLENVKTY